MMTRVASMMMILPNQSAVVMVDMVDMEEVDEQEMDQDLSESELILPLYVLVSPHYGLTRHLFPAIIFYT